MRNTLLAIFALCITACGAQQQINLGTSPNDHTGDSLKVGGKKINDNFTEIYTKVNRLSLASGNSLTVNGIVTITGSPSGGVLNIGTGGILNSAAYSPASDFQPFSATLTTLSLKSISGTGDILCSVSPILDSPTITGIANVPTAADGNASSQVASTLYVDTRVSNAVGSLPFVGEPVPMQSIRTQLIRLQGDMGAGSNYTTIYNISSPTDNSSALYINVGDQLQQTLDLHGGSLELQAPVRFLSGTGYEVQFSLPSNPVGATVYLPNSNFELATIDAFAAAPTVVSYSPSTTTFFLSCNSRTARQRHIVTLTQNSDITFTSLSSGMEGVIVVKQDATGGRSLTFNTTIKVSDGGAGAVTVTAAANAIDVIRWYYDGSNIYVTHSKNFN